MKNTLKRIVSIALMLCMLLSGITFTASADDCDCADCTEYTSVCTDECCGHDHDHDHEEDEALLTEPDGDDASADPSADTEGTPGETPTDGLTDENAEPEAESAELSAEADVVDAASETEEELPAETDSEKEEPAADEAADEDALSETEEELPAETDSEEEISVELYTLTYENGELLLTVSEELLAQLETGEHTFTLSFRNGYSVKFVVTVG